VAAPGAESAVYDCLAATALMKADKFLQFKQHSVCPVAGVERRVSQLARVTREPNASDCLSAWPSFSITLAQPRLLNFCCCIDLSHDG